MTPEDEKAIISPADGRVIKIEEVDEEELLNEKAIKVSIFMSVLNVHVNRAPCTGTIKTISYSKGKFSLPVLTRHQSLTREIQFLSKLKMEDRYLPYR